MSLIALSIAVGYLIGSIPTAYLVVRSRSRIDIRKSGSGNVGAANTYKVTRSKFLSVLVALLDAVKGAIAVYVGVIIGDGEFWIWGSAAIAAVAGHIYPVWLGFHGGRGLATACGATLTWAWFFPVLWLIFWWLSKKILRDTHYANISAILGILFAAILLPGDLIERMSSFTTSADAIRVFALILCTLLVSGHIGPLKRIVSGRSS